MAACSTRGEVRRSAFTLVELLVVLVIITLLLAVVLPALAGAREAGRSVLCASNLRQMSLGFHAYAYERRDWWMVGGGAGDNVNWARLLSYQLDLRYVGEQGVTIGGAAWNGNVSYAFQPAYYTFDLTTKTRRNMIFHCPTELNLGFTNAWGGQNATSYRYNTGFEYQKCLGVSDRYTVMSEASRQNIGRIRLPEIADASNTIVVGDSIRANGDFEGTAANLRNISYLSTYHGGGANVLWVDGHASSLTQATAKVSHFTRAKD